MSEQQRHRLTGWRRMWLMLMDSAARASSVNGASPAECFAIVRSPHTVKNEKFLAGMHLIDYALPGFARSCTRALQDFRRLPFANQNMRMIGAGLGQNVYLFTTSCGPMVMKIDRESQALSSVELLQEARRIKQEHEKIRGWYADIAGFIPPETYLIVNGPLQGRRALATIQPYVAEPLRGVFEDFTEAELLRLFGDHPGLAQSFVAFCSRAAQIFSQTGESIDLLGARNLCIRGVEMPSLYFVDAHDIYGSVRLSRYPARYGQIEDRIAYLLRLAQVVSS